MPLSPSSNCRQHDFARWIGEMRILDDQHRGDRDQPLDQVRNQLRYPFGPVKLLHFCHFWAGGESDVEHDTE